MDVLVQGDDLGVDVALRGHKLIKLCQELGIVACPALAVEQWMMQ